MRMQLGPSQQGEPSAANHPSPGAPRTWGSCLLPKETMPWSREVGQASVSGGFSQVVATVETEPFTAETEKAQMGKLTGDQGSPGLACIH